MKISMSESPNPKVQKSLYHLEDKNLNQLNLITKRKIKKEVGMI
jgi:hypothetical protein